MPIYVQIKKNEKGETVLETQNTPPDGWDDSEDEVLEILAEAARQEAREEVKKQNPEVAEQCRRQMLEELLHSHS